MKLRPPTSPAEALRLAERLGWTITPTTKGWRLRHPDGGTTVVHKSPSDYRWGRNLLCDLRRTAGR